VRRSLVDYKLTIKILSGLLIIIGLFLCLPVLHAAVGKSKNFLSLSSLALCIIGLGLIGSLSLKHYKAEVNLRTGFLVVALAWSVTTLISAIPFYLSGTLHSPVDCFFEAASGLTGTGASVIADIEGTDQPIVLWRSMTQWMGGMGIIVFFIAIMPILGINGVQLFRAESTGTSRDRMTPRVRDTAKNLWQIYTIFTVVLTALLAVSGMSVFDAFNHAMTAIGTGGFSTKNIGVAHFNSALIEFWLGSFMILSSINYGLHFRLLEQRDTSVFRDSELKAYALFLFLVILAMALVNYGSVYPSFLESVRHVFFVVSTTSSTTGFTGANYELWPQFNQFMICLIMVMGGCTGSTAGGMKCVRWLAAFRLLLKELKLALHPHAIIPVTVNDHNIREPVASAIWALIFIYLGSLCFFSMILMLQGVDIVTALSGVISCLSGVGPGLGAVGPYDNYSGLMDISKLALSAAMLAGRLEFMAFAVLLLPDFWRR
jgi:trk system potassium uptake protein